MSIISPTGKKTIRIDSAGSGKFGAPRGSRKHSGIDLEVEPGQPIMAPMKCLIKRKAIPYADTPYYSGVLLIDGPVQIKLFYFDPDLSKIGSMVEQGEVIGVAQDISERYGPQMIPHLHMEMRVYGVLVDPEQFLA